MLVISLIAVACLVFALRTMGRKPSPFVDARPKPLLTQYHDGAWYWIEKDAKSGSRLVRANASGRKDIAAAEEVLDFSISGDRIAWTARDMGVWTIATAKLDGGSPVKIKQSALVASGVWLSKDRVYWLEQTPALIPDSGPLPPLESGIKVASATTTGGDTKEHAKLMEPEGISVIGVRGTDLFVATFRPGALGTTAFIRIPLGGGIPVRVASTISRQSALLTSAGDLYWLGPSRESSQTMTSASVYRLSSSNKVEYLTDWLPGGGRLSETSRGVVYVDGLYTANAWPIASASELPRPMSIPPDFAVAGVGGGEIVLRPFSEGSPASQPLYRIAMP